MNAIALLLKPLSFLGIDEPIAYTLIGRGWSALAGLITLVLVASFLSPDEQGFYFTFGSILALNIFFELGLSYVILQFASHEKVKLEWTSQGTLGGDSIAKARLASLLRMSLKWYGVAAVLMVATILPAGLVFFSSHQPTAVEVRWQLPWMWVVLVSAGNLFISPVFAALEGCGLVAQIASVRAGQSILGSLLVWLALSQSWGLFAVPVLYTSGLLWAVGWLTLRKRHFLADLLSFREKSAAISWWREVWPFQWKIALSWLSGYFIFQLFNPVLFAFHGPVMAGQMGMSLSATNMISTMAMAWLSTKAAPFGSLIAQKEFKKLDWIFFRTLWQSLAVVAFGGVAFWAATFYLYNMHHPWGLRLLDPLPLGLLITTTIVNQIIFAEAAYLRAHKQEPFVWMSVLSGCLIGLSTYFLGLQFGAIGMVAGYFMITLFVSLVIGTWIFWKKRRLWHDGL